MGDRLAGKVAFITGAGRGQGESYAVGFAREGANIIAVDLCENVSSTAYDLATPDDLAGTARQVAALGRRIVTAAADVRDFETVKEAMDKGVRDLGRLDIVAANAGIHASGRAEEIEEQVWRDVLETNVTGTWHTCKAAIPHLRSAGGGSIIITSSAVGLKAVPNALPYVTSKHALVGMTRALALELAAKSIRVNSLHPTTINTAMVHNPNTYRLFRPDLDDPGIEDVAEAFESLNALPVGWVEPADVTNAAVYLASDESRYTTGVTLPVDAGFTIK